MPPLWIGILATVVSIGGPAGWLAFKRWREAQSARTRIRFIREQVGRAAKAGLYDDCPVWPKGGLHWAAEPTRPQPTLGELPIGRAPVRASGYGRHALTPNRRPSPQGLTSCP